VAFYLDMWTPDGMEHGRSEGPDRPLTSRMGPGDRNGLQPDLVAGLVAFLLSRGLRSRGRLTMPFTGQARGRGPF
jgi:hypothetical protein